MRVETSRHTVVHCGWPYVPGDVVNAQMSLRYGVAAMLEAGNASVEQYSVDRIDDPALVELASRVDVVADESIDALGSAHRHITRVAIVRRDGSELSGEAKHRIGSPFEPVGRPEIEEKFVQLMAALPGIDGPAIHDVVVALDELGTTATLSDLLRVQIGDGA